MREFENWNKMRGIDFRMRYSPPKQFEAYIEQERQDAWENALIWALTRDTDLNATELVYAIEKELDAKT